MLLIPDNTTLRGFIPNAFLTTLPDAQTLFDKLRPFLLTSETWLKEYLIPEDLLEAQVDAAQTQDDPSYYLPRRIVALDAWLRGIPSVDIIVTPNGIAAAETQNYRPASRAKIEALQGSVRAELDKALTLYLPVLHNTPGWADTLQGRRMKSTLMQTFDYLPALGHTSKLFDAHQSLKDRIRDIEEQIAERYVSMPVMRRLRRLNPCGGAPSASPEEEYLLKRVKAAVRIMLRFDPPSALHEHGDDITRHSLPQLNEAATWIRRHPEVFPEWRGTATARLYEAPRYENRPGSTAHWL